MLEVEIMCSLPFHAHTHHTVQVAIFQIRFPNEAQVQNVLEETPEVMIKKSTFEFWARLRLFAPVWAYLRPKLHPDVS